MTATLKPLRILVVDDSPEDRETYRRLITNRQAGGSGGDGNYVFSESRSGHEGVERCRAEVPDCVLLDYQLPDIDGLEFLSKLNDDRCVPRLPVVMLTGQGNEAVAVDALKLGAQDYLVKGDLTPHGLRRAIHNAIEKVSMDAQLKEANKVLEKQNQRLAELYETAHQFVDNVSHEFRTPLAVIKEFASIIRDGLAGTVSGEQYEYLDIISNRVDDLEIMVNDMLDISKLEAGLLGVSRRVIAVGDIIGHIQNSLERRASVGKVKLEITVEPDLPPVYCDPEKIGRIIINLAVNAVKFSKELGKVELRAGRDAYDSLVQITVKDNGPGISPENLNVIFERFKQVGGGIRSSTKGFGLGLNIARELVHLNFGDIRVDSELGHGSSFSFTIPVAEPAKLIPRYLERIAALRERAAFISLLKATADPSTDPERLEDLDLFIQHQIRRTDLVFRTGIHSWLLVVPTNQIDLVNMLRRMDNAWEESNRNRPNSPLPRLTVEVLKSWRTEDELTKFVGRFQEELRRAEQEHG